MDSSGGLRSRGAVNRGAQQSISSSSSPTTPPSQAAHDTASRARDTAPFPAVSKSPHGETDWIFVLAIACAIVGAIVFSWGVISLFMKGNREEPSSHNVFPYTCTIGVSPVYLSHHERQVRHANQVTFEFTMEHCERPPPGLDIANTVFQGNLRPFFRADGGDNWSLFDHVEEGSLSDKEYELAANPRFRRRDFHIAETKRCGKRLGPVDDGKECVFVHFSLLENTPTRPKGSSQRHNYG